jgi:hypothetical protein
MVRTMNYEEKLEGIEQQVDNLPYIEKEPETVKEPEPFRWRGIHHGYLGAWLQAFGLFFLYMNWDNNLDGVSLIYLVCFIIGWYLIIDDLWEHLVDRNTPARRLWEWMLNHKSWW